jgi:pimeloyl-ACP methyl ester carboxylesterase
VENIAIHERNIAISEFDLTTRVLEAGSGPVVLMLHGNPDTADEWRELMARLSGRYRCIAPDFPGYGKSNLPASFSYSLPDQVRFVDAVVRATAVSGPVVVVVHDTGGMAGTAWASANLDRLRGMVITNTVVFDNFPWFPIARMWGDTSLRGRIRASLGMFALGLRKGALFQRVFGGQCPDLDQQQLDRFTTSFALNREAKRTALRQFRQMMRPGFFAEFEAMRGRILAKVPCRVLWGATDKFVPVQYAHGFGSKQVTILPEAGHWLALTDADALAAEVDAIGKPQAVVRPAVATS